MTHSDLRFWLFAHYANSGRDGKERMKASPQLNDALLPSDGGSVVFGSCASCVNVTSRQHDEEPNLKQSYSPLSRRVGAQMLTNLLSLLSDKWMRLKEDLKTSKILVVRVYSKTLWKNHSSFLLIINGRIQHSANFNRWLKPTRRHPCDLRLTSCSWEVEPILALPRELSSCRRSPSRLCMKLSFCNMIWEYGEFENWLKAALVASKHFPRLPLPFRYSPLTPKYGDTSWAVVV